MKGKSLLVPVRPYRATAALNRPWGLMILFLTPALLLYGSLFVWPMGRAAYLSFFRGAASSTRFTFAGLDNYRTLLRDANFLNAMSHNLQIMLIAGSATLLLAMALSVGLTRVNRGKSLLRVVFLFPNVMPAVATAVLWSFVFNPSFGILNGLLRLVHLEEYCRAWLGEPGLALPSIMFVQVWSGVGFYIVLFYAGILRIPADYLEAARIDGATGWQEFRHVTFPLLSELIKIAVIYIIINSLNVFALVYLVTEGNPDRYVDVSLTYLHEQAFKNGNFGYACAIGVAVLVTLLVLAGLVSRLFKKEAVEL